MRETLQDLRDPTTTPLNFTRSINLALSERGINALRHAGQPSLLDHVLGATIPMRGRMIHGRRPSGELYEEPQDYDVHGRVSRRASSVPPTRKLALTCHPQTIFAIDRGGLNKRLLDMLEAMPNVTLFFNHKLTGADFRHCKAWFELQGAGTEPAGRERSRSRSTS